MACGGHSDADDERNQVADYAALLASLGSSLFSSLLLLLFFFVLSGQDFGAGPVRHVALNRSLSGPLSLLFR